MSPSPGATTATADGLPKGALKGEPKRYWVYLLIDPRDGQIRYVGYTTNPAYRYYMHLCDKGTSHKCNWIKVLRRRRLKPIMEPRWECGSKDHAIVLEHRLIQALHKSKLCKLTNTIGARRRIRNKMLRRLLSKL